MASKSEIFHRRSPKQSRSRATCDAILEAAAQILERDGPARFNTASVAERAGVSIGTLYQYFPDKQAILLAAAHREASAEEPVRVGRQRALMRALIDVLESFVRLTGQTPVRPGRAQALSLPDRDLKRRSRDWIDECVTAFERMLEEIVLTPRRASLPVRVRVRR